MADKEIRIRWLSDETEIDRSIERLQQKLTRMSRSALQMQDIQETGAPLSKRAQYAQKQFQKTGAELLQRESMELEQKQRKETMVMFQKQRELRKMESIESEITAERQKQIDLLKEEINLKAQQVMDIETTKRRVERNLQDLQGGPPTGGDVPGGGVGGRPDNRRAMEMFKDLLKGIGVASIINGALNFTQHRIERDRRLLTDQGLTAQMASRELREQIQGEGARGLFFAGERRQAMQMAAEEQRGMRGLDLAKILGGVAGGAAAGTFIPGVGNLAGALIGGAGAFTGMMGGSARMFNRAFDPEAYRQMLTREGMEKFETNRRMLELQNPLKTIAFDTMQQRADRFIGVERALGLQDRELFGEERRGPQTPAAIQNIMNIPRRRRRFFRNTPFEGPGGTRFNIPGFEPTGTAPLRPGEGGLQGAPGLMDIIGQEEEFDFTRAGRGRERGFLEQAMQPYGTQTPFMQEDVEKSIQALTQAGATTEGARGMAGAALQFQRNLRLQEAPQIMGRLQAAGVETEQTDQAVIKLMSEAVKMGVNASEMPQEMQRMTAITAEIATRGGGFAAGAVESFAAGVTEMTQMGLEGARTAFDEMIERAKTPGGFEGQMGMGFLMGEGAIEAFGPRAAAKIKGDSKLMNTLNQLSSEDLEKDPALAKGIAEQLGMEPNDLIEAMRQKDEFKQTRTRTQMEATEELGEQIRGMTPEQVTSFIEGEGAELYARVAQEDIAAFGVKESGKGGAARRAGIIGRARRMAGGMPEGEGAEEELMNQLTGKPPTPTELIRGAGATGDIARLDAVNQQLDELTNAAKKHTVAAELYNQHFNNFVKYAKESGDALGKMSSQLQQVIEMLEEEGIAAAQPSQ